MESYTSAVLAVRDVLGIYAPNPDLMAESYELEQAVRAAAVSARETGMARDQLVADLDRITTVTIPHDRVGAAYTRHTLAKWAKDAFDHDRIGART